MNAIIFPDPPSAVWPAPGVPPASLTPILGRDKDIQDILELLDQDDVRIVTLLGPGGVGKTRLALEVASVIAPSYAHGAWFVSLDSIRDPDLIPNAVIQALGIQETAHRTATDTLTAMLAGRHMLLVVDNLEHFVHAAAAWLSNLIVHAPRLKLLTTSRIALNIDGEQRFIVAPLPISMNAPEQSAAVMLFAQRAKGVNRSFSLERGAATTVAEICRQLDGLPLAIELAAARTKVLPPKAILARLNDRLTLLAAGHRNVSPRLQSMRDAISWSYELLSEEEQSLFRRLSVFLGGFTLDAAEFVAAWPNPPNKNAAVIDTLQSLVDQSLVQTIPEEADSRFRMLETIREYGEQEIRLRQEEDIAYSAHAAYFRRLAERSEIAMMGADQAMWLNQLEAEYSNIRAAMSWLETHGNLDEAIEIDARIQFFLNIRGHTVEARDRMELRFELPALARKTPTRALALMGMGSLLQHAGEFHKSATMLSEAAQTFLEVQDHFHSAVALCLLAETYEAVGDFKRLRSTALAALEIARTEKLYRIVGNSLDLLAHCEFVTGDLSRARELEQQSFAMARKSGDVQLLAYHFCFRADDALRVDKLDEAEQYALQAKSMMQELGSKRDLPKVWDRLAWISLRRGDLDEAAGRIAMALAIAEECGHTGMVMHQLMRTGVIATELGDFAKASESIAAALTLFDRDIQLVDIGHCLDAYAAIAARAGDPTSAARFMGASASLMKRAGVDQELLDPIANGLQYRPALQSALGKNEFNRVYKEGFELTIDEAIAEALTYKPTLPTLQTDPRINSLSPRELEVLKHMANGLSNQQIADALFLSLRTVTSHVTRIHGKLRVHSRTAAVSFAIRNGLV